MKLAVFDCDGTLVDSLGSIVSSMVSAFEGHGLAAPKAAHVRRMVGLPLVEAIAQLHPEGTMAQWEELTESYKQAFTAERQAGTVEEPLYPGALAALDELESAGYLLGVATGKAMRGLANTLATHDLAKRFVTLQTADLCAGKPSPDMLYRAMDETGARPETTVMLGDTTYDMLMARNAGVPALGVSWGYHESEELTEAGATRVLDHFEQVPQAIETLWEREQ
ncbi:HAD-IA family hydrolase [Magnetospira sp. QH-2]|uniref:HAD-IA family hydrolase n=1 Tax=Magnetospira sp. (strain QH-2) TaxID=1288970 RepID=UPI0003E80D80|nr:HAD-IA family hydrolase [Magnetospira sp. QH-2]CCQ74563.1 HAD-superfamily hydrolase, subfamily IA [Magnetospira sp. QH-2]